MELKTLKDVEQGSGDGYPKPEPFVFSCNLKETAKEWIKSVSHLDSWTIPNEKEKMIDNAIPWIKHFFNIK